MSNVIDFIERMGQDARLRYGSRAELEIALENEDLEPSLQVAILTGDQAKLDRVLGQGVLCCLLFPVKEGEEGGEGDDEQPSRDDEETTSASEHLAAACSG